MANQIVPAGKPVQLRVRASGLDNGEPASFEIVRRSDGEQLATVQGKVVDGFATGEWTPEGPAAEEEVQEWDLAFTVKCAGLETKAAPLKVYTDWVEVKCVDDEDQPIEGVPLVVAVSDTLVPGDSDGAGVFKAEALPYGALEVEIDPPYELVEWTNTQPPQLEARVQKALPAKLVFPEAGQHKQYVNLDPDDAQPDHGHRLTLKARLEEGLAGDRVFVKVVWGETNSARDDPRPEVVGGVEEDWCPEGGAVLTLEQDDGEVELELELGLAGGDTATIYVSGSRSFRKEITEVVTVTTWRRLYYQITRLADGAVPDLAPALAALAEVYVEYELTREVTVAASDDLPVGALLDGAEVRELGVAGTLLNIGEHDVAWWHDKFAQSHAPREAHLILADSLYDCGPGGQPLEQTVEDLADFGRKTLHLADGETYTVFSKSLVDGESSVRPGSRWESAAPPGHPDHGKSGELTGADAEFGSLYGDRLLITLPPAAAAIVGEAREAARAADPTAPDVKHPVKLVVHLHVARGPFGGMTDGLHQVLTTSYDAQGFCGVLVHELGHALKMCLDETPPGLAADDHGRQYTGRGHQGPHCAHGISDEDWSAAQDFRGGDGYCVMWGTSYDGSSTPITFCRRCAPFTRAQGATELSVD